MPMMAEQKTWISKHSEKSVGPTARWCRSAVCGSDGFIPDSEFGGETCELTCNIHQD